VKTQVRDGASLHHSWGLLLTESHVRDAVVRLCELDAKLLRAGGHVRGRDKDAHDVVAAAAGARLSAAGGPHHGSQGDE